MLATELYPYYLQLSLSIYFNYIIIINISRRLIYMYTINSTYFLYY